jgi:RNA polymerase sigma-70 factor (ECF subfamily)
VQEETRLRQADDAQLVRGARDGCREAFGELARRYRTGVYLTARQILGESGPAEDVAQDALLIAFHALPSLADPARFGAWLGAITRHRAQRVARQESRYVPLEPASADHLPAPVAPMPEELAEAFGTLGTDYQTVLHLRYWEEWSVGQIAEFLSLPITTIKWRLHYGRETLRRCLSRPTEETEE